MQKLSKTIETVLKKTQTPVGVTVQPNAATNLENRVSIHSWNDYCIYEGWWLNGKVKLLLLLNFVFFIIIII